MQIKIISRLVLAIIYGSAVAFVFHIFDAGFIYFGGAVVAAAIIYQAIFHNPVLENSFLDKEPGSTVPDDLWEDRRRRRSFKAQFGGPKEWLAELMGIFTGALIILLLLVSYWAYKTSIGFSVMIMALCMALIYADMAFKFRGQNPTKSDDE